MAGAMAQAHVHQVLGLGLSLRQGVLRICGRDCRSFHHDTSDCLLAGSLQLKTVLNLLGCLQ